MNPPPLQVDETTKGESFNGSIPLDFNLRKEHFENWVNGNAIEIGHVQLLLAQPLNDEPMLLIRQMSEIEAWFERMNALFADAKSFYYLAKRASLVSRGSDYTDLDRETIQKSGIVNERRVMDTLEGIVEAMKTKLILGMSLRKTHIAERSTDRPQEL